MFADENSYLLARCFGAFLLYVAIYNCYKLKSGSKKEQGCEYPVFHEAGEGKDVRYRCVYGFGGRIAGHRGGYD